MLVLWWGTEGDMKSSVDAIWQAMWKTMESTGIRLRFKVFGDAEIGSKYKVFLGVERGDIPCNMRDRINIHQTVGKYLTIYVRPEDEDKILLFSTELWKQLSLLQTDHKTYVNWDPRSAYMSGCPGITVRDDAVPLEEIAVVRKWVETKLAQDISQADRECLIFLKEDLEEHKSNAPVCYLSSKAAALLANLLDTNPSDPLGRGNIGPMPEISVVKASELKAALSELRKAPMPKQPEKKDSKLKHDGK